MRMGNNGNFGGERNKSVQRDRSLRNDIGSIDFQISAFPPSFLSLLRSVSHRGNDLAFISPSGPGIFRYRRTESILSLLLLLPSSSFSRPSSRHIATSSPDIRQASRQTWRDQLSPSSPLPDTFLTTVRRLRSRYSSRKHGNTVSII